VGSVHQIFLSVLLGFLATSTSVFSAPLSYQSEKSYQHYLEIKKIHIGAKKIWESGLKSSEGAALNCPELKVLMTYKEKNSWPCQPLFLYCYFSKEQKIDFLDARFVKRSSGRERSSWVFSLWDPFLQKKWFLNFSDSCLQEKLPPGTYPEGIYREEEKSFTWSHYNRLIEIDKEVVRIFDFWFWSQLREHSLSVLFKRLSELREESNLLAPYLLKGKEESVLAEKYCYQQGKTALSSLLSDASVFLPLRDEMNRDLPRWRNFQDMYECDGQESCLSKPTHMGILLTPINHPEFLINERSEFGELRPRTADKTKKWGERLSSTWEEGVIFRCARKIW
jgi:hypothetical protein